MLFFTITTYSKESNIVTETITNVSNGIDTLKTNAINTAKAIDTSSVSKQLYTDLKSGLVGIAGALKVGAEHVYEILVRQQIVNSITWVLIGIVPLLFLLIFGKVMWKWAAENADKSDGFSIFIGFVFYCFTIIPSIICMFHLDTIVTGFINPEFGALEQIMDWVKNNK